MQKGSCSDKSF